MDRPAPVDGVGSPPRQGSCPLEDLTAQERAVYRALAARPGRVLSRTQIARAAGLEALNERRCDALLVGVRRAIGSGAVRTVRGRGWMLVP
jgi:DNA-binding response OmpR family regulator